MVEFQTIKSEEIRFGKNNFLEVARKQCKADEGADDTEFIAISRGFFLPDGSRRYKKSLAIPDEKEIKEFITANINKV